MSHHFARMIADVISETFENVVGRWQVKNDKKKALLVSFKTSINYDKEDGYRHLALLVYAPMNYVQVWTRDLWDVIPNEDLEVIPGDPDGDTRVKKGKKYNRGTSDWKMIGDHDSCWRDSIDRLLNERERDIICFDKIGGWYDVKELSADELKKFELAREQHILDRNRAIGENAKKSKPAGT